MFIFSLDFPLAAYHSHVSYILSPHCTGEDSEDLGDRRDSPKPTRGEGSEPGLEPGSFDLKYWPLLPGFQAPSAVGCVLTPTEASLAQDACWHPLTGKCLPAEQGVALMLPNHAPAQARVFEALGEGGIESKMLGLQSKPRAELFSLSPQLHLSH